MACPQEQDMPDSSEIMLKSEFTSVGKSIPKIGVKERLRGAPIFSADLDFDDALVLSVLRSTRAHAKIAAINTDRALKVKGIVKIFTAKDIPGKNLTGIINKDQPLLADQKVRAVGEPIALVAAENEAAAHQARDLIDVTYEELPAVLTPPDALKPDAPNVHA